MSHPDQLIITCARATEKALQFELRDLGVPRDDLDKEQGAVLAPYSHELLARVHVWSRIAMRVVVPLTRFSAGTEDELVAQLSELPFEDHVTAKTTFAVTAFLRDCPWTHTHYAAQRVKDVIVDRMRDLGHGRPSVDTQSPAVRFVLHWRKNQVTLGLDATGDPLHRRGYRPKDAKAPLKESLAAAILAIGHADVSRPFLDPCCGSGTLAIEQAWRSLDWAPNSTRRFAFERWRTLDQALAEAIAQARIEAKDRRRDKLQAPVLLSDYSGIAVDQATEALQRAGLKKHLEVRRQDARKAVWPNNRPVVCTNLPYGTRMGKGGGHLQLDGFYRTLGAHLKTVQDGRILLFTNHRQATKLLGLGRAKRWKLFNGPQAVSLFRWDT